MIAVDSSTLVSYLAGEEGTDIDLLDVALASNQAHLPPVVVTETLSAPNLSQSVEDLILALPMLTIFEGHWERAGHLRRQLLARGLRAPLADTLIAQCCLDHGVALITRDGDFAAFARYCGLDVA